MSSETTNFGKHIQDWIRQLQTWCINTFGKVKTVNGVSPDSNGNVSVISPGYDKLNNLPCINNVTLIGNKNASDLKLAPSSHAHNITDVTNLKSELDGKATVNHTHNEYAVKDHTHTDYATKKGIAENVTTKSVELSGAASHGGYIDFHYANDMSEDDTSRIIEDAKGVISIYHKDPTTNGRVLGSMRVGNIAASTISGTTYSGITAEMVTVVRDDVVSEATAQAHIRYLTKSRPAYMSALVLSTPSNNISTSDTHWFVVHPDTYTYRYHTYFAGWYMIKSIKCSVKLGTYESDSSIGSVTLCTSNDGTQVFCLPLGKDTMIEFNTRDNYSEGIGSFEFNILKGVSNL